MLKYCSLLIALALISGCASLEHKYNKLPVGSTRSDVAKIMGPAPYVFTHENIDAWRYAVVAGFGYCNYREFYIYRDVLIYKNKYNRVSAAGCTLGLRNIAWETILTAAKKHDNASPPPSNYQPPTNIIDQLKELEKLMDRGALTQDEYRRAKNSVLNRP